MKTIKLDIDESIFDKVMYFLNHLPKKDVKLKIEDNQNKQTLKKLNAISIRTKGYKFNREEAHDR